MTDAAFNDHTFASDTIRNAGLWLFERRWLISAIGAVMLGVSLLASLGDHPPEPSSCKGPPAMPFVAAQVTTPLSHRPV
jgi:hypothetical protein